MNAYTITLKTQDLSLTVTTIEASSRSSAFKKLTMSGLAPDNVVDIKTIPIPRIRAKPSSGTVTPSNKMRTDILKEIQVSNYVSAAGVDYDKDAVDSILNARHEKIASSMYCNHPEESQYCHFESREVKEFVDFIF